MEDFFGPLRKARAVLRRGGLLVEGLLNFQSRSIFCQEGSRKVLQGFVVLRRCNDILVERVFFCNASAKALHEEW